MNDRDTLLFAYLCFVFFFIFIVFGDDIIFTLKTFNLWVFYYYSCYFGFTLPFSTFLKRLFFSILFIILLITWYFRSRRGGGWR